MFMRSEYKRPVEDDHWKSDSLVINNSQDILREMSQYTKDMIVNIKILDDRSIPRGDSTHNKKRKAASLGRAIDNDSSSSSDSDWQQRWIGLCTTR